MPQIIKQKEISIEYRKFIIQKKLYNSLNIHRYLNLQIQYKRYSVFNLVMDNLMDINSQMSQKYKVIADQQDWKQILKEIHLQNIPVQFNKSNLGIKQLYANHVPKQLYVKHSYDKLKNSLNIYVKQFQQICHKTLQNNNKKYKSLQQHQDIIRLGLQQITEELAFLNLRPISQIVHLLNNLVFQISMNFINFIKSVKKTYFSNFQRKKQSKDFPPNLCNDCKQHRQQMLIKDLKRKLNLNKMDLLPQSVYDGDQGQQGIVKKTDRQKQAEIISNFHKIKQRVAQNLQKQQEKQRLWYQNDIKSTDFKINTQNITNDILMNEKDTYIQQLNALLQGRQVHQTSNTQAYSYLINQLMQFPHLDKLHQEQYAKEAQKITDKIQSQLFQNFIATLSDPLRQVLRKILSKKYLKNEGQQISIKKVKKITVQVQTSSIQFEQKIKHLQKQLQRRNFELNYIKHNKQELQKKYIQKYQQQRQNQKQIHENFLTMKDLRRKIDQIKQQKQILHENIQKEKSFQALTMRRMQSQYQKTLTDIKVVNQKKYHEYREKLNKDVETKIKKINQQKQQTINYLKSFSQLKHGGQISIFQSLNTIKTIGIPTDSEVHNNYNNQKINLLNSGLNQSNRFNKSNSGLNQLKRIQSKEEQKNKRSNQFSRKNKQKNSKTVKYLIQQKGSQVSLQIQNKQNYVKEGLKINKDQHFKSQKINKINKQKQSEHQQQSQNNNKQQSKDKQQKIQKTQSFKFFNDESIKSIDLMIKQNQSKQKYLKQNHIVVKQQNNNQNEINSQVFKNEIFKKFNNQNLLNTNKLISNGSIKRMQRKTTNQFNTQKRKKQYLTMETQKSSPNKNISNRKFRKTHKQVQFSFKRKPILTQLSNNNHQSQNKKVLNKLNTQMSQDQIKEELMKKNQLIYEEQQDDEQKLQSKIQENKNQKQEVKSTVKFKNITLNQQLEQSSKNIQNGTYKINYKKPNNKKQTSPNKSNKIIKNNNFSLYNLSQTNKSFKSFSKSNLKFNIQQNQFQEQLEINKNYNLDEVKTMIQKQFQYFKLTGLIDQFINLQYKQQVNIKNHLFHIAKRNILSNNFQQKTINLHKSKDHFTKSHQTLRQIISKSMRKLNNYNISNNLNNSKKLQIQQLSQSLLKEINKIQTFSLPKAQDLQIFGGKQNAKRFQYQYLNNKQSEFVVLNGLNQDNDYNLIVYFQKLYQLDKLKYIQYLNFLKYPISYLNGNLSKLIKSNSTYLKQPVLSFQYDKNFIKCIFNKIILFHQTQHNKLCIHLQKFLKKIGYFKYFNKNNL